MTRWIIIDELKARGYEADPVEVTKNGVVMEGITVGTGTIRPTIYTEQYEDCDNVDMVVDEIIEACEEAKRNMPSFDMENIMDWDYVKTRLQLCIQRNGDDSIVKRSFLDLEQYVRVMISDDASFKVTSEHLEKFGVTEDVLFHAAWDCTRPTLTATDMVEIMAEMMGMDVEDLREMSKDISQIVITNKNKTHGAIAMCDTELLREIANEYNANLTVLPSSIHECIVIPMTDGTDFEALNMMVSEVNEAEVDPLEQLSDHAYYYNRFLNKLFESQEKCAESLN